MSVHGESSVTGDGRIAVIGMAVRVPGADDVDAFWQNLLGGVESLTRLDPDRLVREGHSPELVADPEFVQLRPLMSDVEGFDASYFGFSVREAEVLDPQHRVFLEVCDTAAQSAGYDPHRLPGRTGVFGGCAPNTYAMRNVYPNTVVRDAVGDVAIDVSNSLDYLAPRVAHCFGLTGPTVSLATACSTSLVAVHLAVRALLAGECDGAFAGGVHIPQPYYTGHVATPGSLYSTDGHVHAFDAAACGTNFGNGAGVVLLRRYADAVADGDPVLAVIRGSAVTNDGGAVGFTAPGEDGQVRVVAAALAAAGDIDPDTIGYVEAHGTGTPLGDPVEIRSLTRAYRAAGAQRTGQIPLGSVKTNVGHLGTAAGVTGLAKAVLALRHGRIPASLNFHSPHPDLDLGATPFTLADRLTPWPDHGPMRRAAVSSFGIGGTNAHVILEEHVPVPPKPTQGRVRDEWQILPLSAASPTALDRMRAELGTSLDGITAPGLAAVARTLQVGRPQLRHRTAVVATDGAAACDALRALTGTSVHAPREAASVAFLLPGQGSQHLGMLAAAAQAHSLVDEIVDQCARVLADELDVPLRELLWRPAAGADSGARLRETRFAQPALFVCEYALARLWQSWGVRPAATTGHSVGEYVAACLAGVFTLEEALRLVALRGRLAWSLPRGSMLAVPLSESEARAWTGSGVDLAAVNGPAACVLSGPAPAVDLVAERLAADGIAATRLRTSHAFHSAMVDAAIDPLAAAIKAVGPQTPEQPFVSTVTGTWITDDQARDPSYWARQMRAPVRFHDSVGVLAAAGHVLLEVGPGRALTSLARRAAPAGTLVVPSQPAADDGGSGARALAEAAAALWSAGVDLDWDEAGAVPGGRAVLPTYPYERRRCWIDRPAELDAPVISGTTSPADDAGPVTVPGWRVAAAPAPEQAAPGGSWLVLGDGGGIVDAVAERIGAALAAHVMVGSGFEQVDGRRYRVMPQSEPDLERVLDTVASAGGRPPRVLHGWSGVDGGHGRAALLTLLRLFRRRWPDATVDVRIVTRGAWNVSGDERVDPDQALVVGPARVAPVELAGVRVQLVDLPATVGTASRPADVDALLAELAGDGTDPTVALRGARRWVPSSSTVDLPERVDLPRLLRRRGVYLLTGGLGGIALEIAGELVRTAGARVVLVGRHGLPARASWDAMLAGAGTDDETADRVRRVRALEAAGGEVLVAEADVTDRIAMSRVVEAARERFGRVDGVFHAAGVPGGQLLEMHDPEQGDAVLAPKVEGLKVLDDLLGEEIDLLVLFSSIVVTSGDHGTADYGSANAWLDAVAQARTGGVVRTVSIAWCGWDEVGMVGRTREVAPAALRGGSSGRSEVHEVPEVDRSEAATHPLLGRRALGTGDDIVYSWRTGPEAHWVLTDHRMGTRPVLPGVAIVEMMRAAYAESMIAGPALVRDVLFLEPLVVDRPTEVLLHGVPMGSAGRAFTVYSRTLPEDGAGRTTGPWRRHASGSVIAAGGRPGAGEAIDLSGLRAAADVDDWLPDLRATDQAVTFGPHWQTVRHVDVLGTGEQIVDLALPDGTQTDAAAFWLHPALFDGATSLGLYLAGRVSRPVSFLPVAYGEVHVRAPLGDGVVAHVRPRPALPDDELLVFDISVHDQEGRLLADVTGFTIHLLDAAALHAELDRERTEGPAATATATATDARSGPVPVPEQLLSPRQGLDLLWRMLDGPAEPCFVVSLEPLSVRKRRVVATRDGLASAGSSLAGPRRSPETGAPTTDDGAPATTTESRMLALWRDAFGDDHLAVSSDFFDIGGNSLVAVQLAMRIREEFGVNMPGIAVLEYPTVRELALQVDVLSGSPDDILAVEGDAP